MVETLDRSGDRVWDLNGMVRIIAKAIYEIKSSGAVLISNVIETLK